MLVRTLFAAAILVAAAVVGCSASTRSQVKAATLSRVVSAQLEKEVGQRPDRVVCPDDLDAEEGAKTRCTLTAGSTNYGVTVAVTSVKGSNVKFTIEVDDTPQG